MAAGPDAEQDERTADCLNRLECLTKDNRGNHHGKKRDKELETRHARGTNHGDSGEVEDVREATRTECGIEDAKERNGWDCG